MNNDRDLMTRLALDQMSNSDYREFDRDLMTKLALQNPQQTTFCTCSKCGDFQGRKEFCDKCNNPLIKKTE